MICSSVLRADRRFCIKSNDDCIALMDAVAEIGGEDRHQLFHRLLKDHVISTMKSDMTSMVFSDDVLHRVHQVFPSS